MFFRLGAVETGDGICLDGGRVNQIPIVEQLIYNFASLVDLEFTQLLDGLKVLGVKRSEAGGVQVWVENSMLFAQIDIIDDVTSEKVRGAELGRVPFEVGGDGEDIFSDWRNQDVRAG